MTGKSLALNVLFFPPPNMDDMPPMSGFFTGKAGAGSRRLRLWPPALLWVAVVDWAAFAFVAAAADGIGVP